MPNDTNVEQQETSGAYQCFHCGSRSVIWDSDFDYDDYGLDGDGIIHELHCTNCGASITYYIPDENEEDEENEKDPKND